MNKICKLTTIQYTMYKYMINYYITLEVKANIYCNYKIIIIIKKAKEPILESSF